jgi:flagellar basal body P-ring formation protein FlgA
MQRLFKIGAGVALSFLAAAVAAGGELMPVLKLTVYPGDVITADMIEMKPATAPQGRAAFVTDSQTLAGKTSLRTLLPGYPIPRTAIREPYVVVRGKTVPVVFQSGTITITGVAQALESGSAGEMVSARNPDSGVVIRGVIQPDGTLRAQ